MKYVACLATVALFLLLCAVGGIATSVHYGRGIPSLRGWCELDWVGTCTFGVADVTELGQLTLYPAPGPPGSGLHVPLADVPGSELLFLLESKVPRGHLLIILDEVDIASLSVPGVGNWWVRVEDLPPQGTLRLELGPYMGALSINSVHYSCQSAPFLMPKPRDKCWDEFLIGLVAGATLVGLWVLFMGLGK